MVSADASIPATLPLALKPSTVAGLAKLTGLDRMDVYIIEDSVHLLLYKVRGNEMQSPHTLCVLGCQSRSSRHRVTSVRRDGFLVGFQTSVAGSQPCPGRQNIGDGERTPRPKGPTPQWLRPSAC